MSNGSVDIVVGDVSSLEHEAVLELHGLGTLGTKLAADLDFDSLGAIVHDEAQHSVAGTAHSQTCQQLVLDRLALGSSAKSSVVHALGVQLDGSILEAPTTLQTNKQSKKEFTQKKQDAASSFSPQKLPERRW